jgi:hypothetical protein
LPKTVTAGKLDRPLADVFIEKLRQGRAGLMGLKDVGQVFDGDVAQQHIHE